MLLISALGTSDPVRDLRDGPLLHILRHYRPDKVMLLLSKEIDKLCQEDQRIEKIQEHMKESWNYEPIFIPLCINTKNPHLITEVAGPIHNALRNFTEQYPDEKVLINLSSGTPMMKTVLSMESLDPDYLGIQVSNPSKRSGIDQTRSNDKSYDVDLEIKLNLDDEEQENLLEIPKDKGRCLETELGYIKIRDQLENIKGLLKNYDYSTLAQLTELPEIIRDLSQHLNQRKNLNQSQARKISKKLNLPFSLYPENKKSTWTSKELEEIREIIDYYMALMLLKRTGHYSDFILRLNPFVISLQEYLIDSLLDSKRYGSLFKEKKGKAGKVLLRKDINELDSELLEYLDQKNYGYYQDDKFFSMRLGNQILNYYYEKGKIDKETLELFNDLESLNSFRNIAAHTLNLQDKYTLEKELSYDLDGLEKKLDNLILNLFSVATPELLNVYETSNQYILDYLDSILE